MVSRPAFAITTAKYGKPAAPAKAIQRYGLGKITVKTKQAVRTIMEMKYLFWRADWSWVRAKGAVVISNTFFFLAMYEE